jgi:hypothetical protein
MQLAEDVQEPNNSNHPCCPRMNTKLVLVLPMLNQEQYI